VDCEILKNLEIISRFKGLQTLEIRSCYNIKTIDAITSLKELKILRLKYCPSIRDISCLAELPNIEEIEVYKCAYNIKLGGLRKTMQSKLKISTEKTIVNILEPPKVMDDDFEIPDY
jgi:Leucine-rich repeat (LRR) protein